MTTLTDKPKKSHGVMFRVILGLLVLLLVFVSFYVFGIHIPYIDHENDLVDIRNDIIEKNSLTYDNYFNEYDREATYYVIKVKVNGTSVYQAYDEDYALKDTYTGEVVSEDSVLETIKKDYEITCKSAEIGYESGRFLYCAKYQNDSHLHYFYYALDTGEFIKEYRL